jgi:uncharacterized protein YceH (UPF0502 family)
MAVIFVLLMVLAGIVIGDAVVENTGPATVTLFHHRFAELTLGQFLAAAAAVGLLLLLFLATAATSSQAARMRRRERRQTHRGMGRRLQDLERENASLRRQLGDDDRGHDDRGRGGRWQSGRAAGA